MVNQALPTRSFANAAAVVGGVVVAIVLLFIGPWPLRAVNAPTGDGDIAALLADHAQAGHHRLTAFVIDGGAARDAATEFGGLGMDEHTEHEIGSITKTFTTDLLRQQVERGEISLDTTVGEVVGDIGDVSDSELAGVTVEELANHTSGLPRLPRSFMVTSFFNNVVFGNPYRGVTPADVLNQAAHAQLRGRGERNYSNLGNAVLGQVLARNAGMTYEELLKRDILDPLGLDETYLATPGSVGANAPHGRTGAGKHASAWEMDGYAPMGAIRSTSADMAKYARYVLAEGDLNLGWIPGDNNTVWHNGGTGGYSTMLILDPDNHTAVYVAGDTPQGTEDLAEKLLQNTVEKR